MKKITENELTRKITSVEQYFNARAIIYIDAIDVPEFIASQAKTINYEGKTYITIVLSGQPQNMILNTPIKHSIAGYNTIISFDKEDLPEVISQGKIFDFSKFYRNPDYCKNTINGFQYKFRISPEFVFKNYIEPYTGNELESI